MQWDNTAMTDLIKALEKEMDIDKQRQVYQDIHQQMYRDIPIIGLFNEYTVDVTRATVTGYQPWLTGRPRLWGVSKQTSIRQ